MWCVQRVCSKGIILKQGFIMLPKFHKVQIMCKVQGCLKYSDKLWCREFYSDFAVEACMTNEQQMVHTRPPRSLPWQQEFVPIGTAACVKWQVSEPGDDVLFHVSVCRSGWPASCFLTRPERLKSLGPILPLGVQVGNGAAGRWKLTDVARVQIWQSLTMSRLQLTWIITEGPVGTAQ